MNLDLIINHNKAFIFGIILKVMVRLKLDQAMLDEIASKHSDSRFRGLVQMMGRLDTRFMDGTYINFCDNRPGIVVESVLSEIILGDKLNGYFGGKEGYEEIKQVIGDTSDIPSHNPAWISYVRKFDDGLVQFAGFGQVWSSEKGHVAWAKYGHLPKCNQGLSLDDNCEKGKLDEDYPEVSKLYSLGVGPKDTGHSEQNWRQGCIANRCVSLHTLREIDIKSYQKKSS